MSNNLNQQVVSRCLETIKRRLKTLQLKYIDVAKQLEVSEVTIKRMLNHNDISLERLLQLAEVCDLDVGKLLNDAKNVQISHHFFTDSQDKTFDSQPHVFRYFCELFYADKTAEQIALDYGLDEVSTYRYLRILENIELIELFPENQFKLLVEPPLGFAANSRVLKKNIGQFLQQSCDAVLSDEPDECSFMRIKPLNLPLELFQQMEFELKKIVDRYSAISETSFALDNEQSEFLLTMVGHPLNMADVEETEIIKI